MTRIVRCPDVYQPCEGELAIFLAGGITACYDWQSVLTAEFPKLSKVVLINPRREHFDMADPYAAAAQIEWEYKHLAKMQAAIFWFPHNTLCPITLFELGKWVISRRPIFIGTDPAYQRRYDVIKQLSLIPRYRTTPIRDDMFKVIDDAVKFAKRFHIGEDDHV